MARFINYGRRITPDTVWLELHLGVLDAVIYDDELIRAEEVKTLDDMYMKLYGVSRKEWLDYIELCMEKYL